jgi:hypothetical protein
MKKKFNVSSYASMMQPGTLSMKELAELQLKMKDHVDAIVDAPSQDEVKSALEALEAMKDGTEPDGDDGHARGVGEDGEDKLS